jgi:hypothetical protein
MNRNLACAAAVLALGAGACVGDTTPPAAAPSPTIATVTITRSVQGSQPDSVSTVIVKRRGKQILKQPFGAAGGSVSQHRPEVDVTLPPGNYEFIDYQQVCSKDCHKLGHPHRVCKLGVTVTHENLTIAVHLGQHGCSIEAG